MQEVLRADLILYRENTRSSLKLLPLNRANGDSGFHEISRHPKIEPISTVTYSSMEHVKHSRTPDPLQLVHTHYQFSIIIPKWEA